MTSGNDKKGPPGRPVPQRPAGPATGGAAARPPQRPAPPPAARPAPGAPSRPAPSYSADEDKTSALDISSLGLDVDEATMASDGAALRAKAAAAMPGDDEKTTAFNVNDLPPEDEPKRPVQKTLLGYPAPKGGAPIRGGASAPAPRPAAPAPAFEEEKTTAMSIADIDKIDALPPRPARPAEAQVDDEKTTALSIADIDKIDALPARPAKPAVTPPRPQAAPAPSAKVAAPVAKAPPAKAPAPARPAQIAEEERTMAVNLDDIARLDAGRGGRAAPAHAADDERTMAVNLDDMKPKELPRKPAALAKAPAQAPALKAAPEAVVADEKTTAMSLDEIEKLENLLPRRKVEAPPQARASFAKQVDTGTEENGGFLEDSGYALQHDALDAQLESGKLSGVRLDPARKARGIRNLIIIGGVVAVVITVFAFVN